MGDKEEGQYILFEGEKKGMGWGISMVSLNKQRIQCT